ncbi:MAG: N-acetyltransferase [Anaerolineaceae bacterium]|nr:MAG: N-acetyltransferase [Anaerolineaceae bacterium]
MTPAVQIREFDFEDDYVSVLSLWQGIETGMHVGPSDTPGEIKKKLERDPDLFLVAELENRIIGSIIGAFDGRRGMIYHLAVHGDFRRQGIGGLLLAEVEKRLKAKGCIKCLLVVMDDNETAKRFYEESGWDLVPEDRVFAKMFI